MDDDVKEILDKAGLLEFFLKFTSFSESISLQAAETWDEGRVKVDELDFTISERLIAEVSGLPLDGEVICREKTNQVEQLSKFIRDDETFRWLQSGIARESLPAPWDTVAIQVMKYLTLEGKYCKLFGYHIAILNSIRNSVKINVPLFLLKSLEKSIKTIRSGKGKLPLHQGPTSSAPKPSADSSDLEEEEDNPSKDSRVSARKRRDIRKRKLAPQVLASSLAKCSKRSSRLQKKSAKKVKIIDYVDSSEDEKMEKDDVNPVDSGKNGKDSEPLEEINDSAKEVVNRLKTLNSGETLTLLGQLDIPAYASLLEACANMKTPAEGKQIHAQMLINGIDQHVFLGNKLVGMYAKCGSMMDARLLFDKMPKRSVFLWNVMIRGYAGTGLCEEAVKFYYQMLRTGKQPDKFTFPCVLKACGGLSAFQQGKAIHDRIIRSGFDSDVSVGNALVAMYSKCGSIENARHVFDRMSQRNVVSWTAMIAGYGMHGHVNEALTLFDQLQHASMKPDQITFTAVLSACSHAGLVDEGRIYFDRMIRDFHIMPSVEHYTCMVDLLGRAGRLDEAEDFIKRMPLKPDAGVWGALLGACRNHCNIELGERVAEKIFELDPENAGYYALLSNMYATAGRWDGVAHVRTLLKGKGLKKAPGSSWIEIENRVHIFLVGDKSHPQSEEIYEMLENFARQMQEAGYVPATNFVMHGIGDEEKERILCGHSEVLAITFGLMNTCPGTPLCITKNLRVCDYCHTLTKFISKIVEREIFVRDMNHFHHFKDGLCSCRDYRGEEGTHPLHPQQKVD
eukprot:Gb_08968 [translate_table: standard]